MRFPARRVCGTDWDPAEPLFDLINVRGFRCDGASLPSLLFVIASGLGSEIAADLATLRNRDPLQRQI